MPEAKRHHTVPQFYLRGFADNERLTTVQLPGERRFLQMVRKAASETNFYAIEGHPEGADAFEKRLSFIEKEASAVFARVIRGEWPLELEDRMTLATFITVQALRGPDQRRNMEYIAAQSTRLEIGYGGREGVKEWVKENYGHSPTDDEAEKIWLEATQPGGPPITLTPVAHIKQILNLTSELLPYVAGRPWSLVQFHQRSLITSDTPVSLIPHIDEEQKRWEGTGFLTAWGITYPLTRKLGLLMTDPMPFAKKISIEEVFTGKYDFSDPGTTQLEKFFNAATVRSARAWLYHHPDDSKYVPANLPDPDPVSLELLGAPENFSGEPLFSSP